MNLTNPSIVGPKNSHFVLKVVVVVLLLVCFVLTLPSLVVTNRCKESRITVVGDFLIGDGALWQQIRNNSYKLLELGTLEKYIHHTDLLVLNYEGVIADEGVSRDKGLPTEFSLKTDTDILEAFESDVPTAILLANNHIADYGFQGAEDTLRAFNQSQNLYPIGLHVSEEEAKRGKIVSVGSTSIGLLAFTDLLPKEYYVGSTTAVAKLDEAALQSSIEEMRTRGADFVIVFLHTVEDITKGSSFEPDAHQRSMYRKAIDYGADLVIGQHPHLLQKIELYKGRPIFYSLGLFYYNPAVNQRYTPEHPQYGGTRFEGGGILSLGVCPDGTLGFDVIPIKMSTGNEEVTLLRDFDMKSLINESVVKVQLLYEDLLN